MSDLFSRLPQCIFDSIFHFLFAGFQWWKANLPSNRAYASFSQVAKLWQIKQRDCFFVVRYHQCGLLHRIDPFALKLNHVLDCCLEKLQQLTSLQHLRLEVSNFPYDLSCLFQLRSLSLNSSGQCNHLRILYPSQLKCLVLNGSLVDKVTVPVSIECLEINHSRGYPERTLPISPRTNRFMLKYGSLHLPLYSYDHLEYLSLFHCRFTHFVLPPHIRFLDIYEINPEFETQTLQQFCNQLYKYPTLKVLALDVLFIDFSFLNSLTLDIAYLPSFLSNVPLKNRSYHVSYDIEYVDEPLSCMAYQVRSLSSEIAAS